VSVNPHLAWYEPQRLERYPYSPDLAEIPNDPGVYVFYRKHGSKFQVFYVGKATRLRGRVKTQLNNLKLMNGIHAAANGGRYLAYGEIVLRQKQSVASAIHQAERILIRHFVEEGHELLNIQGAKIKIQTLTNDITSPLKGLVPKLAHIDA